jgi:hypothetical protein
MRYTQEEIDRYALREVKCPKCGQTGTLVYRKEHGEMFWCVRHHWQQHGSEYKEDKFCHISKNLPLHIRDILDGKKPTTLDSFSKSEK